MIKPKIRRFSQKEVKLRIHSANEKQINQCFENAPAHYGYDAVVLDIKIKSIDDDILSKLEGPLVKVIRNEYADQTEENIHFRYVYLSVNIPNIGELTLGQGDNYPYSKFTRLRLTHGGVNVETISTGTLIQKFETACDTFKEFGIFIERAEADFFTCELAFTFACDDILPLHCRDLVLRSFSKEKSSYTRKPYTHTSTPKDTHVLAVERYKNKSTELYDKTAKAEHLNQISNTIKHQIRVYRLEHFLNKEKFKNIFGTNSLFEIKDFDIENFFRSNIANAIEYYIHTMYSDSVADARTKLKELNKLKENNSSSIFVLLKDSLFAECDALHSVIIIDAEVFVFVDLKDIYDKSNIATRRHSAIKKCEIPSLKHTGKAFKYMPRDLFKNPLSQMNGWETERILNLMYTTINNGLGCKMGTGEKPPQFFKVSYGNFTYKLKYLNELINAPKRYIHLDAKEIVRDRILNKWSDPTFILNLIENK